MSPILAGHGRRALEQVFYRGPVSANPPKRDAWRPYGDVRFVLIRNSGRLKPSRGLVRDWKREGRRWEALVVWHDDAALKPVVKMDWLRIEQLIPVPVDPNWTGGETTA
jgi:hypothetical protein